MARAASTCRLLPSQAVRSRSTSAHEIQSGQGSSPRAGSSRTNSPGVGTAYRAVANGPGVTPVVYWHGPPPGNYSQSEGLTRPALGIFDILGSGRKPFVQFQADWYSTELLALFSASDRCHHSY